MTFQPSPDLQAQLRELASHPDETAIVSDIDGTICRIAPSPDEAFVPEEATRLLAQLASHFSVVALLSGRCVSDMFRMVPVERLLMAGNHGMEWLCAGERTVSEQVASEPERMERIVDELRERVGPDVLVEPKGLSISFHYRSAPDVEKVRQRLISILEPFARSRALRLQQGRMVVDLRPDCPLDKGTALEEILRAHGLRRVLVLGDDLTDVSAFRRLRELRRSGGASGVAIGVVSAETKDRIAREADYLVSGPDDIIFLLRELLDLVALAKSSS
ncbi:MAG: trehalose-phosphatase [Actinobacteria bacterium]|nr:MAG: trehalose-phosphatase [Actinomycetota bacterium]